MDSTDSIVAYVRIQKKSIGNPPARYHTGAIHEKPFTTEAKETSIGLVFKKDFSSTIKTRL